MVVNSHIQIPKFILKNFADQNGTLFQLDAKSMQITPGRAKSLNTKKGYFSNEIEEMMERFFETPFSKVLKSLQSHDFSSSFYYVPEDFRDIVKKICFINNSPNTRNV